MNRYSRDMLMRRNMRDMRNPYGSRGGYVSSRRPRRDREMGDYNDYDMRGGDYGLTYGYHNVGIDASYPSYEQDFYEQDERDFARGRRNDYNYYDMRSADYGYDMARGGRGRGRSRGRDYGDYQDYGDYGEDMKLSKKDMEKWKKHLHNSDGTNGEHFRKEQIEQMAKQWGTDVNKYGGIETFAMAMNMMYSDYCLVAKKYGVDRPEFYAEMTKAFLDDKDFDGEGAEKLALYYKCIVEKDEE